LEFLYLDISVVSCVVFVNAGYLNPSKGRVGSPRRAE